MTITCQWQSWVCFVFNLNYIVINYCKEPQQTYGSQRTKDKMHRITVLVRCVLLD